jgi:hypothetical protein
MRGEKVIGCHAHGDNHPPLATAGRKPGTWPQG